MKDLTQTEKKLTKPEIRVWCHPKSGKSDFWYVFKTIEDAKKFIINEANNKKYRPEDLPLIAYDGFEMTETHYKRYIKTKGNKK